MAVVKAGRNKTIDTPLSEGQIYLDRCITVTQKQVDLTGVLDKTVIGDMLNVCALLPSKSIDLIIADPPRIISQNLLIEQHLQRKKKLITKNTLANG